LLLLTMPEVQPIPSQKMNSQIKNTLSLPIILSGLSLCLLNMVRYGVITWIPLYLFQSGNLTVQQMGKVGLNVFLIPVAGVLGTLVYNQFKIKKDLISVVFLTCLAISFIIFPFTKGLLATIVLLIGSFFLYGPHVFLVTTMPSRFTDKQVVAASAGFIDGMGYIGTVLIGIIIPVLVTTAEGSWTPVFIFWAILSILVAVTVAIVYATHFRFVNNNVK
jgi:sugar phosphate permease